MTIWVLKANGIIKSQTGLYRLTPAEQHRPIENNKRCTHDKAIQAKLGTSLALSSTLAKINEKGATDAEMWPWTMDDIKSEVTFNLLDKEGSPDDIPEADAVDANGKPITLNSVADVMINCGVLLPQGEATYFI